MDNAVSATQPSRINVRLFIGKLILLNVFTALGLSEGHAYLGVFGGILFIFIFT